MKLSLEVAGLEVCSMDVEGNKEVYAAANAWKLLLPRIGIVTYQIFKTIESNANHQREINSDDGNAGSAIEPGSYPALAEISRTPET